MKMSMNCEGHQDSTANDFTWGWEEWGPRPSSPVRHAPSARSRLCARRCVHLARRIAHVRRAFWPDTQA